MDKVACQGWQPEFSSRLCGRRDPAFSHCPLTSTQAVWHICDHTPHTHKLQFFSAYLLQIAEKILFWYKNSFFVCCAGD